MAEDPELHIEHGFDLMSAVSAGEQEAEPRPRAPGQASETVAELRSIVEAIRSLSKAVKAARMYPSNNPVYQRALTDVVEKMGTTFQEHGVIRLVVGQNRLYFQGETVYENTDNEDSLSRLFFRDGIREISFHIGFDREEMNTFLEMVRSAFSREAVDDLVTQLWGDALPHVTYTAIDDMLDQDLVETDVPAEFGSDFMNYVDFEMDFAEEDSGPEPAREDALAAAGEMHKQLLREKGRDILRIEEADIERLRPEVVDEDVPGLIERVLDTFFDVLDQEKDAAARNVILGVVENALVSLVIQDETRGACHILKSMAEMRDRRPDLVQQHREQFDSLMRAASDLARLDRIVEILEEGGRGTRDAESYLAYLPAETIPSLCELLGTVESRRAREALCRALVGHGREAVDRLIPFLSDSRWFLVRNILSVLGQMKAAVAVRHIKPLVTHEDLRVRREALTALSLIGEGEAMEALLSLVRDPDPRMRTTAAASLARLGRVAVNPLLQIVLAKDFESRSMEEKRGFFEALGRTNDTELLPYLKMLLNKKPLFNKTQAEEMRVCAVEALSRMTGPEALALLEVTTRDPSSVVRAAVTGALRRIREAGDEEAQDG